MIYQGIALADGTMWSVAAVVVDWALQEPVVRIDNNNIIIIADHLFNTSTQ